MFLRNKMQISSPLGSFTDPYIGPRAKSCPWYTAHNSNNSKRTKDLAKAFKYFENRCEKAVNPR